MNKEQQFVVFWFRRDLRLFDNKGLYYALHENQQVIPLFIFDTNITDQLPENDARVEFIYHQLETMQKQLQSLGRSLWIFKGRPKEIIKRIMEKYNITKVYTNMDHEPYGIGRDYEIESLLRKNGISFRLYLDHLIFEKDEVVKSDGSPYHIYTPYGKRCRELITSGHLKHYESEKILGHFTPLTPPPFPTLADLGFNPSGIGFPGNNDRLPVIKKYHQTRDFPAQNGTTRLGVHLRFGTISLRQLTKQAMKINDKYFSELLWREFYAMILWHYPYVVNLSFKPQYNNVEWQNNTVHFELWKKGKTGYPLVDAGMRELAITGYMHNRVRMITAGFLTKHLLIDWRWGEAWFAKKLLDFELSSNNGGWQWSAGSGCDAAPYFRIFNPMEQQRKFDPKGEYIKKWIPEFDSLDYPQPIVDHQTARVRCLKTFKIALNT